MLQHFPVAECIFYNCSTSLNYKRIVSLSV